MRRYSEIRLRESARFLPGWGPNNHASLPYQEKFTAPAFEITRAPGEVVYDVVHVATGEACEVPVANVRVAVLVRAEPEPKAAKGGKRG